MDTKLKKSKIITSYVLFFSTIILTTILILFASYSSYTMWEYSMTNDYQETSQFREFISSRLETFVSMATGGTPSMEGFSGNIIYDYQLESTISETETTTSYDKVIHSYTETSDESNSYIVDESTVSYEYGSYKNTFDNSAENKALADAIHKALCTDKNLLYSISYKGKILYSNTNNMDIDFNSTTLSSNNYNFLLKFDGEKVTITKDGKEIDIYGEGYYYIDKSMWYVPGYKNFIVDENLSDVTIYMAVAKNPVFYANMGYGTTYQIADNSLYNIKNSLQNAQTIFKLIVFIAVITLLSFIGSCLTRKYRMAGNEIIAKFTGRFLLEVKLIFTFLLFMVIVFTIEFILECVGLYGTEFFFIDIMFSLFLCMYLLFNDFKHNKPIFKNSLFYKIYDAAKTEQLALSVSKKIINRFRFFIYIWVLAIFAICILMLAIFWEFYEVGIMIDFFIFAFTAFVSWIFVQNLKANKQLAVDLGILNEQITSIHNGNYTTTANFPTDSDLYEMSQKLDDIQKGMSKAIDEQIKSERMKIELITNVSHDLKTPLTSIISYIELLKKEDELPDYAKDYIKILDEKSIRLNNMVQDIFTVSKAVSGELLVNIECLDFVKLILQTLADMNEQIETSKTIIKTTLPDASVMINADGDRMYRVLQNLIQNALKYSLEGSRIYISLSTEANMAIANIKNTSAKELDDTVDFTERFVRGDASRTDGGSGLGLSIAKSFTENCGGKFELSTNADLFVVTITFPICESEHE